MICNTGAEAMIRKLVQLFAIIISFAASPTFAESTHHDWATSLGDDKRSIYAGTTNSDGSVLMESCGLNSRQCTWMMSGDTSCEKDSVSPALLNSDKYAGSIDLKCLGVVSKGTFGYAFTDWKTLESLIKESKNVAIAVAIGDSHFKVYRFSLFGMTEAQAEAESAFTYMLKNSNSPIDSGAGNSVL